MKSGLVAIALISGAALASQVGMNNALRGRMRHPLLAALTSFAIGTTALAIYVAILRPGVPSRDVLLRGPWWMWLGGLVGAFYVAASSVYAARLGASAWFGLIVAGQILASLVMDHFGLVGFPRRPMDFTRAAGAALLVAGVTLVLWTRGDGGRSPEQVGRTPESRAAPPR